MEYINKYLDGHDRHIRKMWLISTATMYIFGITLFIIGCGFASRYMAHISPQAAMDPNMHNQIMLGLYIGGAIVALTCLTYFYALYYCAYKKCGNRFLTLTIILAAFSLFTSLPNVLAGSAVMLATFPPVISLLLLCFLIISLGIQIWQLWMSIQLRIVNKSLQEIAVRSSPTYAEAIASIARAPTLGSTEEAFSSAIHEWPRLFFRSTCIRLLRAEYNNKRVSLLSGK